MVDLWRRLEAHLARHSPSVLGFLNPPAGAATLRRAEAALGLSLPADLAASLLVHDGQPQITGRGPMPIPLVPAQYSSERGDSIATWGLLNSLEHIVRTTPKQGRQRYGPAVEAAQYFEYEGPVRRDGRWSWVTFVDSGSGDVLAVDLNPARGGQVGQVLSIVHDPGWLFVLAPSYRAWFEQLVERYEAGRYVIGEKGGGLTALDLAKDGPI